MAQLEITESNLSGDLILIPHRIFLNQIDNFNSRHISSYLADQIFKSNRKTTDGEEGEGEAEENATEVEETEAAAEEEPKLKYEIIGTLFKSFHKKTEDILFTIDEKKGNFVSHVLQCGFVVYDITKDPDEIPKALATLSAMELEIEKLKEFGPKTFKNLSELRVFILISTVMTWAFTKPIDPEDPEVPFTEADYKKRKTHPNYKQHIDCEKEVMMKGRKNKAKLKTFVIASGIIYGADEEDLLFLFKLAWNNEPELPIFRPGKNTIPLIHIKDLAKVIHGLMEKAPNKPQYILAVEQTPSSFKQTVKGLAKTMGQLRVKNVSVEEAFLYPEITQSLFDRYTLNLTMEPGYIVEELAIEWQNEMNLPENINNLIKEFKTTRELKPLKVIIHGPPAAGKTKLAKQLTSYYGAHYATAKTIIDESIKELQNTIEMEKAKIQAKEDKANALAEAGAAAEEEVEEEEDEAEEIDIGELEEKVKDIETAIAESGNGKLPDEQLNTLVRTFLLSNRCQNQGYILDGYPKTLEQTKALFSGGGDEGEEVGEEEDEDGGGIKVLPDFVISLEATDKFLCERIMRLPEREVQGTHYTEENMLRRLSEFRANNTEDNTLLNFFDEMEIHPIVLSIMDDATERMEITLQTLISRLGKRVAFALTPEEEEQLIRLEEEKQKMLQREEQLKRDAKERQAVSDYQRKMEQWTELLEQLQMEEEKVLMAHAEPLRGYLVRFIFPTLSKGLLEVARLKPDDPVDFLAEYLFKENPEGHMFDPSYTREGIRILDVFKETVEKDLTELNKEEV